MHVFLQTEFRHPLLRVEIGRILTDDLPIDVEGFFGLAFFEVVFAKGQIVLDGAAQQAPLGIQIPEKSVHIVPGGIELKDFLIGRNGLERRAFRPKRGRGLDERRHGICRRVTLEVQFADGIMNAAVARRLSRELLPFADGGVELTF